MPLSELYRLAKRRVDSHQDFDAGSDVFELVWENGQITTQGQSSRARRDNTLPSFTPKCRDKDSSASNTATTKSTKFVDSATNDVPISDEIDDEIIPWLNYPLDCPDFLPELSGVTVHENSNQMNPASIPIVRSRFPDTAGDSNRGSLSSFPSSKTQKPESVINFSHFSRPSIFARAAMKDKLGITDSRSKSACSGVDLKLMEHSKTVFREDLSKNASESTTQNLQEPVVASSSVCSGNSVERASDEPNALKRRFTDADDSECHSEDVEEDSVVAKKNGVLRASSSKRSRAAEVHNLSERRRRDRINEKMRALQELIPNCNKVDKASMLDEAIEYLKTLQLQVQIMSIGAGLCMPPMMMPGMHGPHLGHFSPMMGMGMGMGFGMDMSASSASGYFPGVPTQRGAHFPGMGGPVFGQGPPMMPIMGGPFMKPAGHPYTSKDQAAQNAGSVNPNNHASSQGQATNERFEQPSSTQNSVQSSDKSDLKHINPPI